MSSPAEHTLVQPDYATKPVTYLRDVLIKAISFVPKGANGKRWLLFKNEEGVGVTDELVEYSPLIKKYDAASDDWSVAYIVVAEPGDVDKQRDVWDEAEIKKACHAFIPSGGLLNFNHGTMDSVGQLSENFIAHEDWTMTTPEGPVEIKKGSWVIGVTPSPEVKAQIQSGEIGGMSVQGSAQREEVTGEVAKADKTDLPVAIGTAGDGVTKLQNILGVEETGKYNEATEAALVEWMKGRGVPGLPTIATVKLALSTAVTPVAAPPQAAPVEDGESLTEKTDEPYNPAQGDNVPPRPVGTPGVNTQTVNPDSTTEDLKALIAQAIREGNEGLEKYMGAKYGGSAVGDLYSQDISHEDLWFLISKFVLGTAPSINANGDYETDKPEVEKGAWTGSMGGHDPDAHKGGAYNFVRTFGEWAKGSQAIAARKLLANGVVKTPEAANRLCFVAGTLVETKDRGQIAIENLVPYDAISGLGDLVRTHKGHFRPVVSVVANKNVNPLYTVTSELNDLPIQVTKNHNLLIARGAEFREGGRIRNRSKDALQKAGIDAPVRSAIDTLYPKQSLGTVEWADVQDINEHDYLLFPKNREVVDRLDVSDDFLWLVGMYAAEGSGICRTGEGNPRGRATKNPKRSAPLWSFDIEEPLVAECAERLEREFGVKARIYRAPNGDVVGVDSTASGCWGIGVAVTDELATAISGNQWTKRFADWVLNLPEDRLRIVLDAYWLGDGHMRPHRNEAVATTVSRDLAYQLRQILVYLGERPSIRQCRVRRTEVIEGRTVNGSDTWSVSYNPNARATRRKGLGNDDYIAFPIHDIVVSEAPEWVYDVQIAEDNSLIASGIVAHNSSWLKDQWLGSTKWRKGNTKNLHKADVDELRSFLTEMGENAEEVVAKMDDSELLKTLHAHEEGVEKSPDALAQITAALKQAGDDPAAAVTHIKAILAGPQETEKSDPAIQALKSALTAAVAEEDPAARAAAVEQIVQEFARYKTRKGDQMDSTATADDSGVEAKAPSHAPTFLNKGEDMTGPHIDEATAASLAQAASFITSTLGGASMEQEDPAEVEKDAVPPQLKGKKAPPFVAGDGGPKEGDEAPAEMPAAPDKEGDLEDALDDEGDEVSEGELLEVMNHLVDEVDEMKSRLSALEKLDGKLDKIDELAKALTVSDDVTDQVNGFATELSEISKSVSSGATQKDVEQLRKSLDSVAKRLDGIAKTPNRSGVIPVDAPKVSASAPQAVAKSATALENPWADPENNPFR